MKRIAGALLLTLATMQALSAESERPASVTPPSFTTQEYDELAQALLLTPGDYMAEYIKLSPFQDLAWRTMGRYAKTKAAQSQALEDALLKAHMKIRPEEYLAYVLMATVVMAIVDSWELDQRRVYDKTND